MTGVVYNSLYHVNGSYMVVVTNMIWYKLQLPICGLVKLQLRVYGLVNILGLKNLLLLDIRQA